jgi:hypothetical protein
MIEGNLFCSFPEFSVVVYCQSISVYMWFSSVYIPRLAKTLSVQ